MTTARNHYHEALLVELRKAPSKRSRYRIRKYRNGMRDYDKGFRDGNNEHPVIIGRDEVTRFEHGKATRIRTIINHGRRRG